MNIPKIISAVPTESYTLIVSFTNGERKKYDVGRLLGRESFAPLSNSAFFKNVTVEPGGYAVSWNSEIDISEYELWRNGESMP